MKTFYIALAALALAALACTLTGGPAPQATPSGTPSPTHQPTEARAELSALVDPTATPAPSCQVQTGITGGQLHVRTCGSVACAVLGYLQEGDTIQPTRRAGAWLYIAELSGWVNSQFTTCESETP